jgi:tetratricopeptide (TPR) repeat protein
MMDKLCISTVSCFLLCAIAMVLNPHCFALATVEQVTHKNMPTRITNRHTPLTPQAKQFINQIAEIEASAIAALDAGKYTEAEIDARQSISMGSVRGQELLAMALYAQGKNQEALLVYRQIASSGANAARNEWPYALLLLEAGQWSQAVSAYNTALQLGGDVDLLRQEGIFSADVPQPEELSVVIHIGLGVTQVGVSSWGGRLQNDKAMANFQQALTLAPNSSIANYYYGYGLWRVGRKIEAQAAFKKAAMLDGGDGNVKAAAEKAMAW